MSSRLDPSEYDLGELRAAVRWARLDRATDGDAPPGARHGRDDERTAAPRASGPERDGGASHDVDGGASQGGDGGSSATGRRVTGESRARSDPDSTWRPGADRRVGPLARYDHVAPRDGDAGTDDSSSHADTRAGDDGATGPPADVHLLSRLSADVDRPYLDRLPAGYAAQRWVLDWMEGLLATGGREGAEAALEHYEAVGWLSPACRERLETFLDGVDAPAPDVSGRLSPTRHRESLRYVAWLAHGTRASGGASGDRR